MLIAQMTRTTMMPMTTQPVVDMKSSKFGKRC
jgi:hypothetical protein